MNQYEVTFNRSGEITKLKTEAETHYQAILNGCSIMAKRYGVTKASMIRFFNADKLNCECHEATHD
jgi:hypothetical protein